MQMFDELTKYKEKNHFFLSPSDNLVKVCNVPENKSGIYIIYALKNGGIELVQIACSNENEAIRNQIIKQQFFWRSKMQKENIEALDIYWYITQTSESLNDPGKIKEKLLITHQEIYGYAPGWNIND